MRNNTKELTRAGVIAAVYAALTLLAQPISFGYGGALQLRVSEALTILPVLMPAAVPGLFVGCLVANVLGGGTALDIVFGSLATLIAAVCTRRLRDKPYLAALMPVLFNAVVVGAVLTRVVENYPFWMAAGSVGLGEMVACYALGMPLLYALRKLPQVKA